MTKCPTVDATFPVRPDAAMDPEVSPRTALLSLVTIAFAVFYRWLRACLGLRAEATGDDARHSRQHAEDAKE